LSLKRNRLIKKNAERRQLQEELLEEKPQPLEIQTPNPDPDTNGTKSAYISSSIKVTKDTTPVVGKSKPTRGVLMIVRFLTDIPTFAVVKDAEKPLIGFPYGGVEESDVDILFAASRETKEEIFYEPENTEGIQIDFSPEGLFGETLLARRDQETGELQQHQVFFLTTDMPAGTLIHKGVDQTAAFRVTGEKIDKLIDDGIFLPMHTDAWRLFKQKTARGQK